MEKYFKFEGSATRSEYWAVFLITTYIAFLLYLLGFAISGAFGFIVVALTYILDKFINVTNAVRRARNAGINQYWGAATLLPLSGSIVAIVLGCLKTDEPAA